jgi:hypothetical protein
MEYFLGSHLLNHIGMGAHPDATRRDIAQQGVKIGAVAPFVNRVDPDKHTIEPGELCAHGVEDIVLIDNRLRIHANVGERREDGLEPAALWRSATPRGFIAAP